MPWPSAIRPVMAFMLSTVVWSFAVSCFAFAMLSVTLPELDATSLSIRSTSAVICVENSRKFAVVASMLARLDSSILRSSCERIEHVLDDPGQPLLAEGAARATP